jgi:DNA ligase (NAD+)
MKATEFLRKLEDISREELVEIKGIGEVLADNYIEFIESDRYRELIGGFDALEKKGKNISITIPSQTSSQNLPLSKETIVITGSFDISRTKIKTLLEQQGAHVTESVSGSTTILLAGEKAGSKLEKAQKLGIKILNNYTDLVS